VDFVVTDHGRVSQLIQVSWDVSQPKPLARELKALCEAAQKLNCEHLILIAMTQSRTEKMEGHEIRVMAAHEWLLGTE
jgi:hypothetical protein